VLHRTLMKESPAYAAQTEKLESIGLEDFGNQLYPAAKRGRTLQRQMVLADIFQYIFIGRGYFVAVKSPENMRRYIRLLFQTANLLLLQENLEVDAATRTKLIENLEEELGSGFYDMKEKLFNSAMAGLKAFSGKRVRNEGKEFENALDSLLPKRNGLAVELIVFAMLLLKNYGYLVPLLLNQRLIRGGTQNAVKVDYVAPPDFLLLREKGEVFGIEIGGGKDAQNTKFSAYTSIPLFAVRLGDLMMPQPYRCGSCDRWITYADHVIEGLISGTILPETESIAASDLLREERISQDELVYYGVATNRDGVSQELRYHYDCVAAQPDVKAQLAKSETSLILPVPFVRGLDMLRDAPPSLIPGEPANETESNGD
jgi:hypothetical protein